MLINSAHLTYCTNIHPGESWAEHFAALKGNFPEIKSHLSPEDAMGIGLRLSNRASLEILAGNNLEGFKQWLQEANAYVFTMNGFPYGGFHDVVVKDQVHAPDWTTTDRVDYTSRLFRILSELLPDGMDGGISTSPLSYKHWYTTREQMAQVMERATVNVLRVVEELHFISEKTGKLLHLDIEPEPDGLLETGEEFIYWYENVLLPAAQKYFSEKLQLTGDEIEQLIRRHVTLCYDVCHFAIGYEAHESVINQLKSKGISVGKIQISAALKGEFADNQEEREAMLKEFAHFDEPTYLHQVIARLDEGDLLRYRDLNEALRSEKIAAEWRAHFHVPVFIEDFGLLQSTRSDISHVLDLWKANPFSSHLEVETYTWSVLPQALKLPMAQSISRELQWVKDQLLT